MAIFTWLKNSLSATQVVCFILCGFLLSLALGINMAEIVSGEWHLGMLEAQDWVIFGFGILFSLIGIIKNGTKQKHNEIMKRLDAIEKQLCLNSLKS